MTMVVEEHQKISINKEKKGILEEIKIIQLNLSKSPIKHKKK
jgi:hypothetical protein